MVDIKAIGANLDNVNACRYNVTSLVRIGTKQ